MRIKTLGIYPQLTATNAIAPGRDTTHWWLLSTYTLKGVAAQSKTVTAPEFGERISNTPCSNTMLSWLLVYETAGMQLDSPYFLTCSCNTIVLVHVNTTGALYYIDVHVHIIPPVHTLAKTDLDCTHLKGHWIELKNYNNAKITLNA